MSAQTKMLVVYVVSSVAMLWAFNASATLVAYEGFDYPAGVIDGQNGGSGFTNAWSSSDSNNQVKVNSLTAIGWPTSGGKLFLNSGASRGANFTNFHFAVDATNYVSIIVNKGGTGGQSSEYLNVFIEAPVANTSHIVGFQFGSDEKVKVYIRATASAKSTEVLHVNTDYLFLMKFISSTTGDENVWLTWYEVGDVLPQDDASVAWKLHASISNNGVSGNSGLNLSTGSNISAYVDEFRIGTKFMDVMPVPLGTLIIIK